MAKSYLPGYLQMAIGTLYVHVEGRAVPLYEIKGELEIRGRRRNFVPADNPDLYYPVFEREPTGKDVYESIKGPKIPDHPDDENLRERGRTAITPLDLRVARVLDEYEYRLIDRCCNDLVAVYGCFEPGQHDAKHEVTVFTIEGKREPVSCSCEAFTFYDEFCCHCEAFRRQEEC